MNIGQALIKESAKEKLLDVTYDRKLSFYTHVQQFCTKTSHKLHVPVKISPFTDSEKAFSCNERFHHFII